MKRLSFFILTLFLLSACASNAQRNALDPSLLTDPTLGKDPAEAQLAEAATSVSKSLSNLNEIQQAVTPVPQTFQPPDPTAYGMANLVTIDFSGPIEPLLNQIANASGYRVRVLGSTPAIPVMVYVDAKNTPLGDVLRNAGYQCGDKANIVIFPKTKIIELRYATTA
jgi:defect in organelle trafficking protein DotD